MARLLKPVLSERCPRRARRRSDSVEEMDVRPGGRWRFVNRGPDGREYAFRGLYREVAYPERIRGTVEYEGTPGREAIVTTAFEEHGGRTTMVDTTVYPSLEDLQQRIDWGMEEGWTESLDRFEEILNSLK